VRSIPGKKTDKKDSKWIADVFKFGLVEPSFMPPADIRQLRDLMRYRFKLVCMRTSEKNRFQNSLTVSNIQLAGVFTDVFGKTSQDILKVILNNPNATLEDIQPYFRKNLKSSPEDILKSINGSFDETQSSKISVCLEHYNNINECIASIEENVLKLIVKYSTEMNLLLTIPGISSTSAMFIIAEIGVNMNAFVDCKHLCSWAGLTPRCKESAGKKQSVRIIKAGQYIKPLLVECALNAIKDKSCPYIKSRYESLKRRRGHKKAIIAIARLLLTSCYYVLRDKTEFDYQRFENLLDKKIKKHSRKINNEEDMISHLQSLGYNVTMQNS
jgi:transposase